MEMKNPGLAAVSNLVTSSSFTVSVLFFAELIKMFSARNSK